MNNNKSNFEIGRDRVKIFLIGSLLFAIAALFFQGAVQAVLVALTLALFAVTVWYMVKYCRCPHCGKVIVMGALAIRTCPRCKHDLFTGKKAKKIKY